MKLTEQQLRFFHTFGYLHVGQLFSADEIGWITREFETALNTFGGGDKHDGSKRTMLLAPCDRTARLCTLVDDPRIVGIASAILSDPRVPPRIRPARIAPPQPAAQSRAKATATPAIITVAANGVGAVQIARAPKPMAARIAPIISGPNRRRPERSLRNRLAGGVVRARASGASEKAAADNRPKTPAFISGSG